MAPPPVVAGFGQTARKPSTCHDFYLHPICVKEGGGGQHPVATTGTSARARKPAKAGMLPTIAGMPATIAGILPTTIAGMPATVSFNTRHNRDANKSRNAGNIINNRHTDGDVTINGRNSRNSRGDSN